MEPELQDVEDKSYFLDNGRKIKIGSLKPRNPAEREFIKAFGSVMPIPEKTRARPVKIQLACVYRIHFLLPLEEIASMLKLAVHRLEAISEQDNWLHYQQKLMQLSQPSQLSRISEHDYEEIEKEQRRRKATIGDLRKAEEKVVEALNESSPHDKSFSSLTTNLKRLRDLIAEALDYDKYRDEQSIGRKAVLIVKAREQQQQRLPDSAPRKVKGEILDV